ncbi:MAG TPA: hypothetical protein VF486_28540 [Actinomycetes bacterium]
MPTERTDQDHRPGNMPRAGAGTPEAAGTDSRHPPGTAAPATRRQAAVAAGLAVALTGFWRLVSPLAGGQLCCDAANYLRMAADPGQPVIRPHSSRVLVPWLTHLLGGGRATYHAITLACLAGALLLTYLLTRRLGAGHAWALLAMAGLACSRGWVFYLYDPYLSDPAAFLLLAGGFLALVRARPTWLLAPLLVLTAGARELFAGMALPVYAWLRGRRGSLVDPRAVLRTAALLAPAVTAYALVLALAPSLPPADYQRPFPTVLAGILDKRMKQDGVLWFGSAFAMSLGVWWPLAVAKLGTEPVRRLAWWLVPVLANCLIGWDWSRYATYAFPVVVPAAALALTHAPRRPLLLAAVALQALLPLADLAAGRPQLNHPGPSLPLSLLLIAVVAVVLVPRPPRFARARST